MGKGKNITTKHDEVTCGRKNTARMENVRNIYFFILLVCKQVLDRCICLVLTDFLLLVLYFLSAQFAPEVQVGDGLGMDLKLSNQVFNSLKQHCYSEQRRSARLHEKKEHSTAVGSAGTFS